MYTTLGCVPVSPLRQLGLSSTAVAKQPIS